MIDTQKVETEGGTEMSLRDFIRLVLGAEKMQAAGQGKRDEGR